MTASLPTTPAEARAEQLANLHLAAQAPSLATDLAAAYGLIATLLEAQAEREAALERVRRLATKWQRWAGRADGHDGELIRECADELRTALATAGGE